MFVIQHQNNYHQIIDLLNEHEHDMSVWHIKIHDKTCMFQC